MQVAFCSKIDFDKLTPCKETVVVSLDGTGERSVNTESDWKIHITTMFKVLEPSGSVGSFKEIDEQSEEFARFIFPYIKDAKKVIFQCTHGEMRSVACAQGLGYSRLGGISDIFSLATGYWLEHSCYGNSVFVGRTAAIMDKTFDQLLND